MDNSTDDLDEDLKWCKMMDDSNSSDQFSHAEDDPECSFEASEEIESIKDSRVTTTARVNESTVSYIIVISFIE